MNNSIKLISIFSAFAISLYSQNWQFSADSLIEKEPILPLVINPFLDGVIPDKDYSNPQSANKKYNGFRVQLISTKDVQQAELMRFKLMSKVESPVILTFEAPNYKVRVGGFINRNKAEQFRDYLYNLGFHNAWVVRARINK